ncbi:MAG: 50S ribosomal protein L29 [Candidatus Coatesbacteria bacterium]|jgi:large subunit ribosomal protein L29|nr:50S ribosomal protein L29 [Candidatus Coatesbacteria bacterium]
MKAKDIRQMTDAELESKCAELTEELMNLRFQLKMKQLSNPARIYLVRKDIARIKTIIRERREPSPSQG